MISQIIKEVADLHDVTVAEIRGGRRFRHLVQARHAAIWVLHQVYPDMAQERIGEAVGVADHTTVVYALRKLDTLVRRGDAYAANLYDIVHKHKGVTTYVATPTPAQKLRGSPDRWAIWNAAQKGTAYVEAA
jgi:hypothetical protein